jgi:hypothetical protein
MFLLALFLALASAINYDHSDAPSCGITYDCHWDDSSFIYDATMFIGQAIVVDVIKQRHSNLPLYFNPTFSRAKTDRVLG